MKTIVITGGTGDLGTVVVPRLLADYRCIVPYRTEESFRKLAMHANLVGVQRLQDVVNHAPLYGLVHLAGGFAEGSSPDDFAKMLEVNLMSAVLAVNAVRPHLQNGGRIVAISSAASLTKAPKLAAYSASKTALNAFVETLAKELRDRSITVNALLPATLDTEAKRATVAESIALLLSDQASGITGQLIGMTV